MVRWYDTIVLSEYACERMSVSLLSCRVNEVNRVRKDQLVRREDREFPEVLDSQAPPEIEDHRSASYIGQPPVRTVRAWEVYHNFLCVIVLLVIILNTRN